MAESELGGRVRALADAITSVEDAFDRLGASVAAFDAVCARWWEWRAAWRTHGEASTHGPDDLPPRLALLDIVETVEHNNGALHFAAPAARTGGAVRRTAVPVAYLEDPDGFERRAAAGGLYVNRAAEARDLARRRAADRIAALEHELITTREELRRLG